MCGMSDSKNGSSSKIGKTILKPAFEQSESEIKKPLDRNRKILNINNLPIKQISKESLVQQNSTEREQKPQTKKGMFFKSLKWWIGSLLVIPVLSIMVITLGRFLNPPKPQPNSASATVSNKLAKTKTVSALGRIEPKGEVITLSPPPSLEGATVTQLLVAKGDRVSKDQTLAILDNQARKAIAVELARQKVKVAKANLAVVRAGTNEGNIKAQASKVKSIEAQLQGTIATNEAEIRLLQAELQSETQEKLAIRDRLQAELNNAKNEFKRHQQLAQAGVISDSELNSLRLVVDIAQKHLEEAQASYNKTLNTLKEQIKQAQSVASQSKDTLKAQITEARSTLNSLAEVRDVDILQAQAKLDQELTALKLAEEDLKLTFLKAPADGQIIQINAFPGELVTSEDGIVEFRQTDNMVVVAEVHESDIAKVQLGQTAILISKSGAFEGEIKGEVSHIGSKIGKRDVLDTDPAADIDSRVVEVEISLDRAVSDLLANLINSKVIVQINQ